MGMIVSKRAGAVLAVAAGLCVAASLPAFSQAPGIRVEGPGIRVEAPGIDERGNADHWRGFGFRYEGDERGNIEGKRASCEVYAKIAQVQADANRKYNCGYEGPRWDHSLEPHFRWCRHVRRDAVVTEVRERAGDLQRCFNRLGDFDEEETDYRR
jgi:hypothetical protein